MWNAQPSHTIFNHELKIKEILKVRYVIGFFPLSSGFWLVRKCLKMCVIFDMVITVQWKPGYWFIFDVICTKQTLDLVWGVHLTQKRKLYTVPRELVGVWPVLLSQAVPLHVYAEELGVPQAAAWGRAARLLSGAVPGARAPRPLQPRQQRPVPLKPPQGASSEEVSHSVASWQNTVWCEVTWPKQRKMGS